MTVEEQFKLISQNTEEVLTGKDLEIYLKSGYEMKHYIGFEISGKIHIGSGLVSMLKVKDFAEAGVKCTVFLADWHTWINGKLGGNMETIQKIAVGYFKEGMKASIKCVGGDESKVSFLLGSDLYHHNDKYWQTLIEVSQKTTLSRTVRSLDIMGRKQEEGIEFAKLIYPPMQVSDIFAQDLTIAHAGTDQRKAHVIMRDVADQLKINPVMRGGKIIKPVAIHQHLLLGLLKPSIWPIPEEQMRDLWVDMKMSKSKPNSAVFIHDSPEDIKSKVMSAFCPVGEVKYNPILDWSKNLIFVIRKELEVKRAEKFGGDKTYKSYKELEEEYKTEVLHPQDLKTAVTESLIDILEPARKHFSVEPSSVYLEELEKLTITR